MNGENGGAVNIGAGMGEYQIDITGIQIFPAFPARLFAVGQAIVEDLPAQLCYFIREKLSVVKQPLPESGKLAPVGFQPHGIKTDPWFFGSFPFFHMLSFLVEIIFFW